MSKLENKIRESYKGILSEEQIEETIKWWNDLLKQEKEDYLDDFAEWFYTRPTTFTRADSILKWVEQFRKEQSE